MRLRWRLLLAGVIAVAQPVSARILTIKPTPSETWNPLLPLTVGGGFEFETDGQESRYDFPLLVEYNFSQQFKLTVEPNFAYIEAKKSDVSSVGGVGDLEVSAEWEFLRERRYRPALTAEGGIRFPTAIHPDLGDPGTDYTLGLIVSKDFVFFDADLSALYTFSGDPANQDILELALSAEIPINHKLDILAEVVHTVGTGIGKAHGGGDETEGTIGVAWHFNKFLKLEEGVTFKNDGSWQILFAWEWNFAGD